MTKSWNPRRAKKRYEQAGSIVLNRVKLGQAPISLRRIRWRHRGLWVLLALVIVGGGLGLWLTVDARFYIYDAEISGTRRLSEDEVFEASALNGLHVLWARSSAIESRILEALPSVASAEASCRLPSECTISIVERRPRVLWDTGSASDGQWWIDEEGAVFPARDLTDGSDVADGAGGWWRVTGPLPRDDEGPDASLDEQVRVALAELWQSGRELPDEFQYSPAYGLSFVDERGWRVIVGRGSGMSRRLEVWERLVEHLESRGATPRFVDVRFPEAPYYVAAAD